MRFLDRIGRLGEIVHVLERGREVEVFGIEGNDAELHVLDGIEGVGEVLHRNLGGIGSFADIIHALGSGSGVPLGTVKNIVSCLFQGLELFECFIIGLFINKARLMQFFQLGRSGIEVEDPVFILVKDICGLTPSSLQSVEYGRER